MACGSGGWDGGGGERLGRERSTIGTELKEGRARSDLIILGESSEE